ncbi:protein of unknown function [Enterobacter cancerogenus]|nr:protein of unknown function [Enterobacter cancerogenus]
MLLRAGQAWGSNGYATSINRKNRIQLSASQTISDTLGNFNISASTQDYWNRSGRDTRYQLGYTNAFKRFNLSINASRTRDLVKINGTTKSPSVFHCRWATAFRRCISTRPMCRSAVIMRFRTL